MHRFALILAVILAMAFLSWCFPLFHVAPREALQAQRNRNSFDAAEYVQHFWKAKLIPSFEDAADAGMVLAALRADPKEARTQFGRTVGISRSSLFYIRGRGTIVSADGKQIGVSMGGNSGQPDLVLLTGLMFGNAARDATGLLKGDAFSNSQQFNAVSAELNRTIEAEVVPPLKKQAAVGATIEFVGCAEVTNLPRDISPLKVVPLNAHVKPRRLNDSQPAA